MTEKVELLMGAIIRFFRARRRPLFENLALRRQLAALKRRRPRPKLSIFDRLFWILARRFWSGWKQAPILVGPETVVRWKPFTAQTGILVGTPAWIELI
jgi:hypothetical protein